MVGGVLKMKRLYSIKGQESEVCHEKSYFQEMLNEGGFFDDRITQLELEVWKANIPNDGTFFCAEDGEVYDSSESYCGLQCSSYEPTNGENGKCRWHRPTYSPTGRTELIRKRRADKS